MKNTVIAFHPFAQGCLSGIALVDSGRGVFFLGRVIDGNDYMPFGVYHATEEGARAAANAEWKAGHDHVMTLRAETDARIASAIDKRATP